MTKKRFIITLTDKTGGKHRRVWNASDPLPLGTPLRWVLENTEESVRIREIPSSVNEIHEPSISEIPFAKIGNGYEVKLPSAKNSLQLHIKPMAVTTPQAATATVGPAYAPTFVGDSRPEILWFIKALKYTSGSMAAILLLIMLWPAAQVDEEELVPPQYAQIVMSKPGEPDAGEEIEDLDKGVEQAENTAVAQAFRAKALQNTVKGLLKGGLTRFIANASSDSARARSVLGSAGRTLTGSQVVNGKQDGRKVNVAKLGGKGGKGGVGYGKGKKAGIRGQGGMFLALETELSEVQAGLSKDEVGKIIHAHMAEVRYCYESALIRNPDIEGRMIADFVINPAGQVHSMKVRKSNLPDPRLDDCILRRLASWKFPRPKGGTKVAVTYPFVFKVLGK